MTSHTITNEDVRAAVLGGAVLGGGGGGWMDQGTLLGQLAVDVGIPQLIPLEDLPDDALLVTVGLVGAPSAKQRYVKPTHYVRAIELLEARIGRKIAGVITNENGGNATVNGWFQAAMLSLPCVDAPCNGRAHPTGIMGSIGLQRSTDYLSIQAAAGGKAEKYVEAVVSGSLTTCATFIRNAAVEAGGVIAVARNPISVAYAREHCALGAIRQAIALGSVMLEHESKGGEAVVQAAMKYLGGEILFQGLIDHVNLKSEGGFDVGTVTIGGVEMTFWNEYMTLDQDGKRIATFPDLIMTFDRITGRPLVTAEIQEGNDVMLVCVPKEHLILGAGMYDQALFQAVERVIGRAVISYSFE
ncbi:DUF917 family protein [Ktedonobacteria bacterium brp13]|nr:DUF917 family protein [Ktedonobacteria bacterium brp13]